MNKYENVIILKSDLKNGEIKKSLKKLEKIIIDNGGQIENSNEIGEKMLAYNIKGYKKGYYVDSLIYCTPETEAKIVRQMRIDDNILKFFDIKTKEIDEETNEKIANTIYNYLSDMDAMDYEETEEETKSELREALAELENSDKKCLQTLYTALTLI